MSKNKKALISEVNNDSLCNKAQILFSDTNKFKDMTFKEVSEIVMELVKRNRQLVGEVNRLRNDGYNFNDIVMKDKSAWR